MKSAVKTARTLGLGWTLERIAVEVDRRSGRSHRKTPIGDWWSWEPAGDRTRTRGVLYPEQVEEIYRGLPAEETDRLKGVVARLKTGVFEVFGTEVNPENWHTDPFSDRTYPATVHWSEIAEFPDADLKLVWEPSRFGWAYDLARHHRLDPDGDAAEVFWELFETWCWDNPPNAGVNWNCGQESSLRLMAVMFATEVFGSAGLTEEREHLLAKFVDVTAHRVLAHWRYARSQRNNHIVSEAVGLLTVAAFYPRLVISQQCFTTGDRLLVESCHELVFDDGGTSQYSLNYHRVFVENFIWAAKLYSMLDRPMPPPLASATERAVLFLAAMADDGATTFFGHNDGAHILPVSSCDFGDVRPTIVAGMAAVSGTAAPATRQHQELAAWLWPTDSNPSLPSVNDQPSSEHFPTTGITVLRSGNDRAIVSGRRYQQRPSHADQCHASLWLDGVQLIVDPGTWSYKPLGDEPDLSTHEFHNAPLIDGRPQMTRLSRFLWTDWSEVKTIVSRTSPSWQGVHQQVDGRSQTRRVRAIPSGWEVRDTFGPVQRSARMTYITPGSAKMEPNGSVTVQVDDVAASLSVTASEGEDRSGATAIQISLEDAVWCPRYRVKQPAVGVVVDIVGPAAEVTVVAKLTALRT